MDDALGRRPAGGTLSAASQLYDAVRADPRWLAARPGDILALNLRLPKREIQAMFEALRSYRGGAGSVLEVPGGPPASPPSDLNPGEREALAVTLEMLARAVRIAAMGAPSGGDTQAPGDDAIEAP